jgi:hypothetical protein
LREVNNLNELGNETDKIVDVPLEKANVSALIQELKDFHEFLAKYPYLGLGDPNGLGLKIQAAIRNWRSSKIVTKTWYRANKFDDESRLFTSAEMGAPDPATEYLWEGRYNHTGQSFLYLTDNPETAFLEMHCDTANVCAMQKFKVTRGIKILDLKHDLKDRKPDADLLAIAIIDSGCLELQPKEDTSWKPEYLIPRFIADCARVEGYEAIQFPSAVRDGTNLVVFPQEPPAFLPKGACYVWKKYWDREVKAIAFT